MKVLVTGSNGFAGAAITAHLAERGFLVRAAQRGAMTRPAGRVEPALLPDLADDVPLAKLCEGVDAVVHAAGLAHQPPGTDEARLMAVNAAGSARLAAAARQAGIPRFLLVSSIRAIAGASAARPLDEGETPAPTDAYGRSKLASERGVREAFPEAVILRPPVLHGAGAKANMARLTRLARSALPLPLAGLNGRRSLLSDLNLAAAVAWLLTHPEGAGRTLHLADGPALTIPEMIGAMRRALGRRPGLFALPSGVPMLRLAAPGLAAQLTADLVVETRAIRALGWSPAEPSRDGLARMVLAAAAQTRL